MKAPRIPASMTEVKSMNIAAGYHFFDRAAMRFFRSRICSGLYKNLCFVTSEIDWSDNRRYSVRRFCLDDCTIETIGEFHSYPTLSAAREAARNYKPEN